MKNQNYFVFVWLVSIGIRAISILAMERRQVLVNQVILLQEWAKEIINLLRKVQRDLEESSHIWMARRAYHKLMTELEKQGSKYPSDFFNIFEENGDEIRSKFDSIILFDVVDFLTKLGDQIDIYCVSRLDLIQPLLPRFVVRVMHHELEENYVTQDVSWRNLYCGSSFYSTRKWDPGILKFFDLEDKVNFKGGGMLHGSYFLVLSETLFFS